MADYHNPRIIDTPNCNAYQGQVVISKVKTLWVSSLLLISIISCYLTFSWQNLVVFLVSTACVLCLGHSLGMHRRLIHQSYQCPKWLEYLLVDRKSVV